ncbi:SIAE acetylesterase, partial [Eubucco bourcierii]|nr:SIAE acetylesterase [Eubucco bourcierii]
FASYYSDHMVLQKEPAGAVVWGYGEPGATVTLALSRDGGIVVVKKLVIVKGPSGTWTTVLEPMAQGGPYELAATQGLENVTLQDVYFGDVWLCSGQSNMAMTVLQIANASRELAAAARYPHVRLFAAAPARSDLEQQDLEGIDLPWAVPTAANLGHGNFTYFSAVCWLLGRALYDAWQYPVGLVQAAWAGTPIEAWSSQRALRACGLLEDTGRGGRREPQSSPLRGACFTPPSPLRVASSSRPAAPPRVPPRQLPSGPQAPSVLWNAMIHPLLRMALRGIAWYQGKPSKREGLGGASPSRGEANAFLHRERYSCSFPALIADWRRTAHAASAGQSQPLLPFGFVQLSTYRRQSPDDSFARLRWHQTADLGVVPNARMPNTFMAVAMDLGDEHSPYGRRVIHPRDKQTVALRLQLGARAVAYGERSLVFQGPYPVRATLEVTKGLLNVTYSQELIWRRRDAVGFEVCCSSQRGWVPAPVVAMTSRTVTLAGCGPLVLGLRYAWAEWPCEYQACALYNRQGLPAPPFL